MENAFSFVFKIDDAFRAMISDNDAHHILVTTEIVSGKLMTGEQVGIIKPTATAYKENHTRTGHGPVTGCPVPPCLGITGGEETDHLECMVEVDNMIRTYNDPAFNQKFNIR